MYLKTAIRSIAALVFVVSLSYIYEVFQSTAWDGEAAACTAADC